MTQTQAEIKEAVEHLKRCMNKQLDPTHRKDDWIYVASDALREVLSALEALEPRRIAAATPSDHQLTSVLIIGGRHKEWTVVRPSWRWYQVQEMRGNETIPTHFIPLSALPQPEVKR